MSYNQDIKELTKLIEQLKCFIENVIRPPEQVILDDVDLRGLLKVSKRTTAYWREKGVVTFSKLGGKIYYKLSDILILLKKNELPAVACTINLTK